MQVYMLREALEDALAKLKKFGDHDELHVMVNSDLDTQMDEFNIHVSDEGIVDIDIEYIEG